MSNPADKIQFENPANRPMHYGDNYVLGAVYPPDYIPKYRLYSYAEGEKMYNKIQYDIYQDSKKARPKSKKGFPKIFKVLAAGICVGLGIFGLKKGLSALISKLRK